MQGKPFFPFLVGAVVRFLLWEPYGFVPMPLTRGGCTVSMVEVEGRRTICLPWPGRGMAEGSPRPSSSLTLKVSPCLQVNSSAESAFGYRQDLAFSWSLCAFSARARANPFRRSQRCPDHHLFNSCFGNWVVFLSRRIDLMSSALCPVRAGAGESMCWTWLADCWGWLASWACTCNIPVPSRELSPFAKDSCSRVAAGQVCLVGNWLQFLFLQTRRIQVVALLGLHRCHRSLNLYFNSERKQQLNGWFAVRIQTAVWFILLKKYCVASCMYFTSVFKYHQKTWQAVWHGFGRRRGSELSPEYCLPPGWAPRMVSL